MSDYPAPRWLEDAQHAQASMQIDGLRAILEPLLDNPWQIVGWTSHDEPECACMFCQIAFSPANTHKPECPVLIRDLILGRTPA